MHSTAVLGLLVVSSLQPDRVSVTSLQITSCHCGQLTLVSDHLTVQRCLLRPSSASWRASILITPETGGVRLFAPLLRLLLDLHVIHRLSVALLGHQQLVLLRREPVPVRHLR